MKNEIQRFLGIEIPEHIVDFTGVEEVQFDGYSRKLVEYLGSEDDEAVAYLFTPKDRDIIGSVLVHHQHNGERHWGKSEVAGILADEFQFFCPELARKGIMSIAPDSICFEDRRTNKKGTEPDPDPMADWLQHYNEMAYRLLTGKLLMKKVIEDASIALSLLLQQEGLDRNKVGTLGHSYGGNTVMFHSAFDDRIKYSCSSGAVCSFKAKFADKTGIEMAEVIPGFANKFDVEDLLSFVAPRELLIVSSTLDKYTRDSKEIYSALINKERGKQSYFFKEFEGEHALNQERFDFMVNWFVQRFQS